MYEVFINHHSLILSNSKARSDYTLYNYKTNFSWSLLLESLKGKKPLKLWIQTDDLNTTWSSFKSNFTSITAAGGLVQNDASLLFIFRNGKWDLPKGKLEKGEIISECAIREVEEECGIDDLTIVRKLLVTYHTYVLGDTMILKDTHWFLMRSAFSSVLTPQLEEGIEEVKWIEKKIFQN